MDTKGSRATKLKIKDLKQNIAIAIAVSRRLQQVSDAKSLHKRSSCAARRGAAVQPHKRDAN